jgi:phosphohistidine phosphatase
MVKRLYLLRHAKSNWGDPSLADEERPLAPRGRKAAARMARHLRQEGIRPDLVLCSTALRATETLKAIERALEDTPTRAEKGLYGASAETLLARVRQVPDDVGSVMLIGHNPGLEDLATLLASGGPELPRLREKYPTCALATLDVGEEAWSLLQPGEAELVGLVTPNDLA